MWKRWLNLILCCTITTGLLSGCAGFFRAERPAWRKQAELACLKSGAVKESTYLKRVNAIDGPGICGADYPMRVSALTADVTGSIPEATSLAVTDITPVATFGCPMVAAMERWMNEIVQPAAYARFGQGVLEIKTFGSYSCRGRNNQRGAPLSEHSFANAVDIAAFVLGDGRVVTVVGGWKGQSDEQGFLREVAMGACGIFGTMLAPGSNAFHYNHFHLDMARHNARNGHYCSPVVEVPPRPEFMPPDPAARSANARLEPAAPAERQVAATPYARTASPLDGQRIQTVPARKPPAKLPAYSPDPSILELPSDQEQEDFDPSQYDLTSSVKRRLPR